MAFLPFFVVQSSGRAAAYLPYYTILTCSGLANAIGNFASGAAHHPLTAPDDNPATRWR
jgi:hypothetical protein